MEGCSRKVEQFLLFAAQNHTKSVQLNGSAQNHCPEGRGL